MSAVSSEVHAGSVAYGTMCCSMETGVAMGCAVRGSFLVGAAAIVVAGQFLLWSPGRRAVSLVEVASAVAKERSYGKDCRLGFYSSKPIFSIPRNQSFLQRYSYSKRLHAL